jgi:hypothetical protein
MASRASRCYPGLVRTESVVAAGVFDLTNPESPVFVGRAVAALAANPMSSVERAARWLPRSSPMSMASRTSMANSRDRCEPSSTARETHPLLSSLFDEPGPVASLSEAMNEFRVDIPRVTKSMTRKQAVRRARFLAAQSKVEVVGEPAVWMDWDQPGPSRYVVVFKTTEA